MNECTPDRLPRALLAAAVGALCLAPAAAKPPAPAKPAPLRTARAAELKANVQAFRLHLRYFGEQAKPYYALTLGVAPAAQPAGVQGAKTFHLVRMIGKDAAEKIIDHLAAEGFLDSAALPAAAAPADAGPPQPKQPTYAMHVEGLKAGTLGEDLGWGPKMLARLDALRTVIAAGEPLGETLCPACRKLNVVAVVGRCANCGGATASTAYKLCPKCAAKLRQCRHCRRSLAAPATESMDQLLGRLDEHRRRWQADDERRRPAKTLGAAEIAALIEQLGAAQWKDREAATQALIEGGARAKAALEAKAKQADLDPEVAHRIEQILGEAGERAARTATCPKTGITVSLTPDGGALSATLQGKRLWTLSLRQPCSKVTIRGSAAVVEPINWTVDLQTGRITGYGRPQVVPRPVPIRQGQGGAIIRL